MSIKTFEITEQEINFLEEARQTFHQIIQGNTDWRGPEARFAFALLQNVRPKVVETWTDPEAP